MIQPKVAGRLVAKFRIAAGVIAAAVVGGCVADGPQPPPAPRPVPAQPSGVRVDRLLTAASQVPEDTDRNGYYDQINVTVYLFDNAYPDAPIQVPGTFAFRLTDAKGKKIAEWAMDEAKTQEARRRFMVGPGYLFTLNLLDVGTDKLPAGEGQLNASFTPTGGTPIQPRGGTTILIGPSR